MPSSELTGESPLRPLSPDAGTRWFGERLASLATGSGSVEARTAVLETAPLRRGSMPPLHAHDQDETYHVLEGEVLFYVGSDVVRARAGDVVVAPKCVPRTFRVVSSSARWLVLTALRSLARYEDFARAIARPRRAGGESVGWPSVEEASALAAIARSSARPEHCRRPARGRGGRTPRRRSVISKRVTLALCATLESWRASGSPP